MFGRSIIVCVYRNAGLLNEIYPYMSGLIGLIVTEVVVCLNDEPICAGPNCDQQCGAPCELINLSFNCHSSVCILKGARLLKLQHVKSNLYSTHLL